MLFTFFRRSLSTSSLQRFFTFGPITPKGYPYILTADGEKRLKVAFRGMEKEKAKFKALSCVLPISVGMNSCHEGMKLKATLALINCHFNRCVIMVNDTGQRHTLKIENPLLSSPELYDLAKQRGDEWLARHESLFNKFDIPNEIVRWDRWLYHSQYHNMYDQIEKLYQTNDGFKDATDTTITEFLSRRVVKNRAFAEEQCLEYLLEKCAVFLLLSELNCAYEIYPSGRNKALTKTAELFSHDTFFPQIIGLKFRYCQVDQNYKIKLTEKQSDIKPMLCKVK